MKKMWYYPSSKVTGEVMYEGRINLPQKGNLDDYHPCIWLTSNPDYIEPPDVIYLDRHGFHNVPSKKLIPARIILSIESNLKNWYDYKAISNIPEEVVLYVESYAENESIDLREWYFSEKPIPISKFYEIEFWNRGIWAELPPPNNPSVRH